MTESQSDASVTQEPRGRVPGGMRHRTRQQLMERGVYLRSKRNPIRYPELAPAPEGDAAVAAE